MAAQRSRSCRLVGLVLTVWTQKLGGPWVPARLLMQADRPPGPARLCGPPGCSVPGASPGEGAAEGHRDLLQGLF